MPNQSRPITPPSAHEADALAVAARYLRRVGTATATQLLGGRPDPGDEALLCALRDSLLAGSALCEGLIEARIDAEDT